MQFYVIGSTRSSFHNAIAMTEKETSTKISPYRFESASISNYIDEDSNSSKSKADIREQASFTEQLGGTSWCECAKHVPMPSGIKCLWCRKMKGAAKCVVENESYQCITDHEQFKVRNRFKQKLFIYSSCYDKHNKR